MNNKTELTNKQKIFCNFILITIIFVVIGSICILYKNFHTQVINPYQKNLAKIGVIASQKNGQTTIDGFIKDSNADKSKLQKGDIILKIHNKNIKNLSPTKITTLALGQSETKLKIQVLRKGKKLTIFVPREKVGEYYNYLSDEPSIYTKYLKYDNEKYYFWIKTIDKDSNVDIKNYGYSMILYFVDLNKQEVGSKQINVYDKNDILVQTYKESDTEAISPNTFEYSLYEMIKQIDANSTKKEKEHFKGFLE